MLSNEDLVNLFAEEIIGVVMGDPGYSKEAILETKHEILFRMENDVSVD